MQRDETELLPLWIRYHGELFGYQNLFIYDNGSGYRTQQILRAAEQDYGVNVDYSRTAPEDFESKGAIFAQQISLWSLAEAADYYFPLDCDEFVGVHETDGYSCFPESIYQYLSSIKPIKNAGFQVGERLDNSWHDETVFYRIPRARKLFFGNSEVVGLDVGFHHSEHPSQVMISSIVYFHFHNRPFPELVRRAKGKLSSRLPSVDTEDHQALRGYQGKGSHLIRCLTSSEEEYASWLSSHHSVVTTSLQNRFRDLEVRLPWCGSGDERSAL